MYVHVGGVTNERADNNADADNSEAHRLLIFYP